MSVGVRVRNLSKGDQNGLHLNLHSHLRFACGCKVQVVRWAGYGVYIQYDNGTMGSGLEANNKCRNNVKRQP